MALNATVQAACAGEPGRGFAVVAGEQRMAQAGATMTHIVASVQRVTGTIAGITGAAAQQGAGLGRGHQAANELGRMAQQKAALVEQPTVAVESPRDQVARLPDLPGSFQRTHVH